MLIKFYSYLLISIICLFPFSAAAMPLILLGAGNTDSSSIAEKCNLGFTHFFGYSTESTYSNNVALNNAINSAEKYFYAIKNNCPNAGVVIGIPRNWIAINDTISIKKYISSLNEINIYPDFWYSDEMIYSMVKNGLSLDSANAKFLSATDAVNSSSKVPYIWVEPGNYGPFFQEILSHILRSNNIIKSFDEYIISKLTDINLFESKVIQSIETLKYLSSPNSSVFPVIELGQAKRSKFEPELDDVALLSVLYFIHGAQGLIYFEDRWASKKLLNNFYRVSDIFSKLEKMNIKNFTRDKISPFLWTAAVDDGYVVFFVNMSNTSIENKIIAPADATYLWHGESNFIEARKFVVYYSPCSKMNAVLDGRYQCKLK